ncbi:MAG: DedA family protein [Candidatus Kapabacteria bacterium]|nr:DedA family protein [Candidatus Kapabacteria bacterium]
MNYISSLIDFILRIDVHLAAITAEYGVWAYVILIVIVFAETGLVVTPFLPGDSLLFAAGAICALGTLNIWLLIGVLIIAAVLGDAVNYSIGRNVGHRILGSRFARFIRREHIERTHAFYERHGGKTIILARFMPIVRTFAPFVAGIGEMTYARFATYNVVGGVVWVTSFSMLGYFFGGQPFVKKNFTLVIVAIILISVMPAIVELLRHRFAKRSANG